MSKQALPAAWVRGYHDARSGKPEDTSQVAPAEARDYHDGHITGQYVNGRTGGTIQAAKDGVK